MKKPETVLREKLVRALSPEIGIEPIECESINVGFPDMLLAVPGADGLFPLEAKMGELVYNGTQITVKLQPFQKGKNVTLRRRIKKVLVLIEVPNVGYFATKTLNEQYEVSRIFDSFDCLWRGSDLVGFKRFLLEWVKK